MLLYCHPAVLPEATRPPMVKPKRGEHGNKLSCKVGQLKKKNFQQ